LLRLQGRLSFEEVGAAYVAVAVRPSLCRITPMMRLSSTSRSVAVVTNLRWFPAVLLLF
jgi:hypothetical protein